MRHAKQLQAKLQYFRGLLDGATLTGNQASFVQKCSVELWSTLEAIDRHSNDIHDDSNVDEPQSIEVHDIADASVQFKILPTIDSGSHGGCNTRTVSENNAAPNNPAILPPLSSLGLKFSSQSKSTGEQIKIKTTTVAPSSSPHPELKSSAQVFGDRHTGPFAKCALPPISSWYSSSPTSPKILHGPTSVLPKTSGTLPALIAHSHLGPNTYANAGNKQDTDAILTRMAPSDGRHRQNYFHIPGEFDEHGYSSPDSLTGSISSWHLSASWFSQSPKTRHRTDTRPAPRPRGSDGEWLHDRAPIAPEVQNVNGSSTNATPKLIVSNLHYELTTKDLTQIFGQVGTLVREPLIRYDRSGRSSGVAIISFETTPEATAAKQRYDGKLAKGQPMSIAFHQMQHPATRKGRTTTGSSLLNRIQKPPLLDRLSRTQSEPRDVSKKSGPGPVRTKSRPVREPRAPKKPKTAEDLDKELDAYLKDDAKPPPAGVAPQANEDVDMV
ncbi:uncharacterized protein FIBRA_01619 [Fibroporia radiculosa]|uniref:RRM domain-containing protein n=1 Tax=Fibroporia radiculosa TaxID=599839 RepID=J4I8L1_9APHY|nr:uncharacterized protein FIBRA_01619 [Fibroporia radiculosa]CCL99601.1 predicted protein [Fibroporia radiculosa]